MLNNIEPVEFAERTWWVGRRDPAAIFHCNPYFRSFRGASAGEFRAQEFNLLIDPGSSSDFAVMSTKVTSVLGGLQRISAVFVNHQDPDVGSSAPLILSRFAQKASVVCSEDTWRLIVHGGLSGARATFTERHASGLHLPTAHKLIPVPSPFCHFCGAVMLYDPTTRVLFTGDLLGGLSPRDAQGLDADLNDWAGIRTFHQTYMPTNTALKRAVEAIRALSPAVEIIAPQHGRLIRGALVHEFLDRLERLPVGLDLLADGDADLDGWNALFDRVVETARTMLGSTADQRLADCKHLQDTLEFTGGRITVTSTGRWTIEQAIEALVADEQSPVANMIKMEAVMMAEQLRLPSPRIQIEENDGVGDFARSIQPQNDVAMLGE